MIERMNVRQAAVFRIENGEPVIEVKPLGEFPKSFRFSKMYGYLRRGIVDEMRCWLTGTRLYWAPESLASGEAVRALPWLVSRDHLVCRRRMENGAGQSNIVLMGGYLNRKVGHNPLPLRVLLRRRFAALDYDREDMSAASVQRLMQVIIAVENEFSLGGRYPWQPWSYPEDDPARPAADAIYARLLAAEDEFLALDDAGRAAWLDTVDAERLLG